MPKKKKPTFEENLAELETIVKTLENGNAELDEIMQYCVRGTELSKSCLEELTTVSKEMDILIQDRNGGFIETPLRMGEDR